jgi:hypothetical protein
MTEPQHDQPGKPASGSRGAGYDNRLATIDKRLDAIDARMVVDEPWRLQQASCGALCVTAAYCFSAHARASSGIFGA